MLDVTEAQAILRELDQMRATLEATADKVDALALQVAELRGAQTPAKSGLARDGGLTVSAATIGAIITALVQHFGTR